jgi:TM2 domain-containing membrane protein YozV
MKCAYHPITTASAHCSSCGRLLCSACDHRIKGMPHCQDCIVAGIDMLRRSQNAHYTPDRGGEKSPLIAFFLGIVPGLGAAYNGQNVKALVHFTVIVGLLTLSDVFDWPLEIAFGLGGVSFYCYTLFDAYASAKRRRQGENLAHQDELLKQMLRTNTHLWGGVLIAIGLLAALRTEYPQFVQRIWPLLLVLAGGYFIKQFRAQRKSSEPNLVYRTPPPSVIPSGYDQTTNELFSVDRRYER